MPPRHTSKNNIKIPSTAEDARDAFNTIVDLAKKHKFSGDDLFAIMLALEEALINAVKHGNCDDPNKPVKIEYRITDQTFEITVTDQGNGFTLEDLPDPRSKENLLKCCGRGVLLIKSYMDQVKYNKKGNSVWMLKNKASDAEN